MREGITKFKVVLNDVVFKGLIILKNRLGGGGHQRSL